MGLATQDGARLHVYNYLFILVFLDKEREKK